MDSPSRSGAPLLPISPTRVNRLPQSPSIPNLDPFVTSPIISSVQGKVAQFNNLSKDSSPKRKDNEAALKRAVLGREEAESEAQRLKEENTALRQKLEEARARDQRIAKKFETFTEEKRKLIEHQHKVQNISDQEVRRAQKEAFRCSRALVTAQEDLQKARSHLEALNDQANIERNRGKKYQQEAFDAKLALSDVEDELEALKQQLKTAEEERDVLRTNLNEEQVARVAAEGRLPLPSSSTDDEFASPRKSKNRRVSRRVSSRRESLKENMDPAWRSSNDIFDIMWAAEEGDEFAVAKRNLWVEEKRRQEAEMMIKYLKAEYEQKPKSCGCGARPQNPLLVETSVSAPIVQQTPAETIEPLQSPDIVMEYDDADLGSLDEDTILHHEPAEQCSNDDCHDEMISSTRSEPPPFLIHEDESINSRRQSVQNSHLATKSHLAPIKPSTSPSLLELEVEADKENSNRVSQLHELSPPISRSGINTADTSIISIKSEDVDDSDDSHLCATTPRLVPNQISLLSLSTPVEKLPIQTEHIVAEVREVLIETPPEPLLALPTPPSAPTQTAPANPPPQSKSTPMYRSTTTTVSVPLKGGSPEKSSAKNFPFSPGATMTREQALEAIKQRRRRARSIHDGVAGSRKGLGEMLRRDVSTKSAPS